MSRRPLNTATHDHKRGEDVRARLAVLSELTDGWLAAWRSWSKLNTSQRRAVASGQADGWTPGAAAEAMLYQTLVDCWPTRTAARKPAPRPTRRARRTRYDHSGPAVDRSAPGGWLIRARATSARSR